MKSKALIKFAEQNAKEILAKTPRGQNRAMMYGDTCVLRPWRCPDELITPLTQKEWEDYVEAASLFKTRYEIDAALVWVRKWVGKGTK